MSWMSPWPMMRREGYFLADWVQHIPRAKQHQVTYAGWFANALGNLNPKKDSQTNPVEEQTEKPKLGKWVKWRTMILRAWAVDPECNEILAFRLKSAPA